MNGQLSLEINQGWSKGIIRISLAKYVGYCNCGFSTASCETSFKAGCDLADHIKETHIGTS